MQENIHLVPKIGKENGPGTLDTVPNFPSTGAVNHHAKKEKKNVKSLSRIIQLSLYTSRAIVHIRIHHNFSCNKGKKTLIFEVSKKKGTQGRYKVASYEFRAYA